MVQLPNHYCAKHHEHEAEYLANRQRWARAHSKQYQHKYNNVTRYRNDTKSKQYQFYKTRIWSVLRQQALDRDHYVCQYCGQPNSKTVDHIVPIEYDQQRMASIDNLATICRECHRKKTQWEQSYYGTGQGNQLKSVPEVRKIFEIKKLFSNNSTPAPNVGSKKTHTFQSSCVQTITFQISDPGGLTRAERRALNG